MPPSADLNDISTAYPQEVSYETRVTMRQIRETLKKQAPDKAPGPDEITNRVLTNALPAIECHL